MFILLIAALHCLPPIIGALFAGKTGLCWGIAIGCVIAVFVGALAFTVIDLIGVLIGAMIGAKIARV